MVSSTKSPTNFFMLLKFISQNKNSLDLCFFFQKLNFPSCSKFGFRMISYFILPRISSSSSQQQQQQHFFSWSSIVIIGVSLVPLLWGEYWSILGLLCHCCAQKKAHKKSFLKKDNDLQSFRSHCCCARKKTIEYIRRRWLTKKALYRREATIEHDAPIIPIFVEDMHLIRWYCSGGVVCWYTYSAT